MSPYWRSRHTALWVAVPSYRDTEGRQCYSSSCIRLPSPCRSCTYPQVALKDKILVLSTLLPKHFFGCSIWHLVRHRATSGLLLRGTRPCVLVFGWDQHAQCQTALVVRSVIVVRGCLILALLQSHFDTCHHFVVCPSVKLKESIS